MNRIRWWAVAAWAPIALILIAFSPSSSQSQTLVRNLTMTCMGCHVDPNVGTFHGGFRGLTDLTEGQVNIMCMDCHDGIIATEAAVHSSTSGQFGTWEVGCLGCHNNHYNLENGAGLTDGNGDPLPNVRMLGNLVTESGVLDATDGIARIRRPYIEDTLNNDGTAAEKDRHKDDTMQGYYCGVNPVDQTTNPCSETDPPSATDTVRKLTFTTNAVDLATVDTNPWANPYAQADKDGSKFVDIPAPVNIGDRWYDGACNVCHVRETTHHKRDNNGDPIERNHNLDKKAFGCPECHAHADRFTSPN